LSVVRIYSLVQYLWLRLGTYYVTEVPSNGWVTFAWSVTRSRSPPRLAPFTLT
jgi:hypothetical protein